MVLAGLLIAGCCYLSGRQQRQIRSRHSELLHALSSTSSHVSSPVNSQFGSYPGSPSCSSPSVNAGPVNLPSCPPSRPLPSLVASWVVPPLMSAPLQSSSTPPVPPATASHPRDTQGPSPMLISAPPRPLITTTTKLPARLVSTLSLDKEFIPPPTSTAPSTASTLSGRIVPANSHKDYNRRDFSRSAVPGSVYSSKVTY